jgi:hypothetical protein
MNVRLGIAGLSLFCAAGWSASSATLPASTQISLVNQYCAGCHNDKLKSGGMSLKDLDLQHPDQNAALAEKVICKLRAGMMPPPGLPRPNTTTIKSFAESLEASVDAAAALHPNPGRPVLHRLNRTEYANSVRDLLNVDINVAALLPPDDMSHGFDNMSDALSMSPALMEGYVRAAGKVSREAMGDSSVAPYMATYEVPRVNSQMRHVEGAPVGTRGGTSVVHDFPADGQYVFKMTFYFSLDGPLFGMNQGKGQQIEVSVNGVRAALLDIPPTIKQWDELKTPAIKIKAGPQRVSAAFIQKADGPVDDVLSQPELSLIDLNVAAYPGLTSLPHLHELFINGPFETTGVSDTPSRSKILVCSPATAADDLGCAKKIIAGLARRAYRRPISDPDIEALLSFYQHGKNKGNFETGIRTALQAILTSPEFIFRFEHTPTGLAAGTNYRLTDLELASRLSYFLWSSAPDDELVAVASQGRLRNSVVLEKQVRRMLADAKADSLSANFAAEWLHLQNLKGVQPDAYLYPGFNRNLIQSMRQETQLFFNSIVREDRSVLDLLDANYTFVDERLAKHYGIPNINGDQFRRVSVLDDNRRGLLGQASILTLTSVSNRTSPVQRGKYVMEVLLGTPPPPPPPNVPPLKEVGEGNTVLSVRKRLEQHRANPVCASCHRVIDPIGFSLENFDAIGAWRNFDGGAELDTAGKLFDGTLLNSPSDLRKALLNHSDAFLGTFTDSLLAYGLGRVTDYNDMPEVRSIERKAARDNNRFDSFVMAIVTTPAFQMRRVDEPLLTEKDNKKPADVSSLGAGAAGGMKQAAVHH